MPTYPSLKEVRIRWLDRETIEVWDHIRKITEYEVNKDPRKTFIHRPEHLPKIKGTPDEGDMGLATSPHVQKAPEVEVRSLDYYENLQEEESALCKP
ncbi:hypothetical protein ACFSCZ_05945 [Siminovitchia sediminis]|uniref:Uncharacterized protein n=1 Tax=Siminovitchia sediminis TaxID=1274353 RepID=A0ABW4KGP7_9BACI